MDRRGFLKGVFGGVAAGGVIVAASPEQIEAFASPLAKEAPLALSPVVTQRQTSLPSSGQHLYNEHGELVAIVTEMTITKPVERWDSLDGSSGWMTSGLIHVDIRARGVNSYLLQRDMTPILPDY